MMSQFLNKEDLYKARSERLNKENEKLEEIVSRVSNLFTFFTHSGKDKEEMASIYKAILAINSTSSTN
jgi:hypothetical protein